MTNSIENGQNSATWLYQVPAEKNDIAPNDNHADMFATLENDAPN